MSYLFTSESVSEGHPDKVADQISDALLDEFLAYDKNSKVACETLVTTGQVVLAGEVKSNAYVDVQEVARHVIEKIGYTKSEYQFEAKSCGVFSSIHEQSGDINRGVERENPYDQGAGDQGMMFGYATNETANYMPLALDLAHSLLLELANIRKNEPNLMPYLRPDAKSQVTIEYDEHDAPVRLDTVLVSTQHDPQVDQAWLKEQLTEHVIRPVLDDVLADRVAHDEYRVLVNPTGSFVLGGPAADAGLTGRKIIVDTYGGAAHHGGGAFSGKDPSKVDRSAAYAARWVAKNIVAAGLAHKVEVQVAYAIGVADPVSINVETYGTENGVTREQIQQAVRKVFDLRPAAIIDELDLKRPIYSKTAAYGHFGRNDADFTWETTNKVDELKAAIEG